MSSVIKTGMDMAAFALGNIPKNTHRFKQVKDFVDTAIKAGKTGTPAFKSAIKDLSREGAVFGPQAGIASATGLGLLAVGGAGALGAAAIGLKSRNVNRDLRKINARIEKNIKLSSGQVNKMKAQQRGRRAARGYLKGSGTYNPIVNKK